MNSALASQVRFSFDWAHMQARRWRVRALARHLPVDRLEHDEIVSLIAELWCAITSGKTGCVRLSAGKSAQACVEAYVAGCIDNEIARSMRQENAVAGVHVPRFGTSVVQSLVGLDDYQSDEASTSEEVDPLAIASQNEDVEIYAWAGQLGAMVEHYLDAARSMTVREARKHRCRIFSKKTSRPNMAWAVVKAAAEQDVRTARLLAPMMVARWIDGAGGTILELRATAYPHLDKAPEKTALIAYHESRSLLRWLARLCGNETGVTDTHLDLVAKDAMDGMAGWVGMRGKYAKTAKRVRGAEELVAA